MMVALLNWLRSDAHQIMYSTLGNSAICCTLGAYAQRERGAQSKEREVIRTYIRTSVSEQLPDAASTQSIAHDRTVSVHDKSNGIDTQRMTLGEIVWVARPYKVHLLQRAIRRVLKNSTIGRLCCYRLDHCNANTLPV